jgi:hypothetical protein
MNTKVNGKFRLAAIATFIVLMLVSLPAFGDNTNKLNQFTTDSGRVYKSVQVLKVYPDGLMIQYAPASGGFAMERVAFAELPGEIQKEYNYNSNAAAVYAKKEEENRQKELKEKIAAGAKHWQEVSERSNLLVQIVAAYHTNHVYIGEDTGYAQNIFVCGDMSCDVWDMLARQGVRAAIVVGNTSGWTERVLPNHAWVLAEIEPKNWLALETTGGYVVPISENPNYYHPSFFFRTPQNYHAAVSMIQAYVTAMKNNVEARREFDELSTQLKSAGDDTALKVRLIQQKAVIDQLDAECRDITNKLAMVVD